MLDRRTPLFWKEGKKLNSNARIKRMLKSKEMLLILITIAVILLFYIINRNYLSLGSLQGTMQAMSITGIMAVGVSCLLIGGGIDLGSSMECLFGGVICALMIQSGIPWGFAMIITLAIGALIGLVNAFLISKLGMMPFIATIAVGNVLTGLNLALTNSQNIPVSVESFWWASKLLFGIFPIPFVIMIILLVVYGFVLSKTQFGRNVYLVGGNMYAARLAGVNPIKTKAILYINNGVMSVLAGMVLASRMRSATPSSLSDSQMDAITAAILGGIAFTGGAGGMVGCFIGILLLNFFSAGLNMLALESYWSTIASGVLLVIALTVDFINERSREKALKARPDDTADRKGA